MRLASALCVALVLSIAIPALSQIGNDSEHVIRRIVETGILEGHDQKVIGRLGDAGAVLVTKILAGRVLTSDNIDTALAVVEGSFADPSMVDTASDRQPKTALLLLRYLDLSTSDAALKKRIADTLQYVQGRYAAFLQGAKQ